MTIYLPYGLVCIGIAFVSFNAFRRSSTNKKINRRNRNREKFQETLSVLREEEKKKNLRDDEQDNSG